MRKSVLWALLAVLGPAQAFGQDATLVVKMQAKGPGMFGASFDYHTRVRIHTTSSVAATYNGAVTDTPMDTAGDGTQFSATISGLYSPSAVAGNKYTVTLDWEDDPHQTLSFGPFAVAKGSNTLGKAGLGDPTP